MSAQEELWGAVLAEKKYGCTAQDCERHQDGWLFMRSVTKGLPPIIGELVVKGLSPIEGELAFKGVPSINGELVSMDSPIVKGVPPTIEGELYTIEGEL